MMEAEETFEGLLAELLSVPVTETAAEKAWKEKRRALEEEIRGLTSEINALEDERRGLQRKLDELDQQKDTLVPNNAARTQEILKRMIYLRGK